MNSKKISYWCFSYISFFTLSYSVIWILPINSETYQVLGMFSIPFVIFAVVAGVIGSLTALIFCREWPLIVMTLSFYGLCFIGYIGEVIGNDKQDKHIYLINSTIVLLLMIIVFLSGRWILSKNK